MKPNKTHDDIIFTASDELIIEKIYQEMKQALRNVVIKYLDNVKFDFNKDDDGTTNYPAYLFLAQAKIADDLISFNNKISNNIYSKPYNI